MMINQLSANVISTFKYHVKSIKGIDNYLLPLEIVKVRFNNKICGKHFIHFRIHEEI